MEKPEITYPCRWPYRVIGSDEKSIKVGITEVLSSYTYEVSSGNTSRQGTYSSLHVEVNVAHEDDRNEVFGKLKAIHGVKIVI